MKAILVIKMPSECGWGCPCYRDSMYSDGFCSAICENVTNDDSAKRPTNCPLKPMPEKKEPFYDINEGDYDKRVDGWNACLEELEKC